MPLLLGKIIKPHNKQHRYKNEKSTVDAINHIVDKIKTKEITHVLRLSTPPMLSIASLGQDSFRF